MGPELVAGTMWMPLFFYCSFKSCLSLGCTVNIWQRPQSAGSSVPIDKASIAFLERHRDSGCVQIPDLPRLDIKKTLKPPKM